MEDPKERNEQVGIDFSSAMNIIINHLFVSECACNEDRDEDCVTKLVMFFHICNLSLLQRWSSQHVCSARRSNYKLTSDTYLMKLVMSKIGTFFRLQFYVDDMDFF